MEQLVALPPVPQMPVAQPPVVELPVPQLPVAQMLALEFVRAMPAARTFWEEPMWAPVLLM